MKGGWVRQSSNSFDQTGGSVYYISGGFPKQLVFVMSRSSRIEGFYKLSLAERLSVVKEFAGLTEDEARALSGEAGLAPQAADKMVENAVGTFSMPLGIATNFQINGKDYLVPMAIEEPSVVAAASNAAKMAREKGGFKTRSTSPVMIGQVQVTGVTDPKSCSEEA